MGTSGKRKVVLLTLYENIFISRFGERNVQNVSSALVWRWQRGGWLLVDRITGHVSPINLPEFDAFYSRAAWYRDYVAYCGISDDGKNLYAVVAQLGRRKPILKKTLGDAPPMASRIRPVPRPVGNASQFA